MSTSVCQRVKIKIYSNFSAVCKLGERASGLTEHKVSIVNGGGLRGGVRPGGTGHRNPVVATGMSTHESSEASRHRPRHVVEGLIGPVTARRDNPVG